MSAVPNCVPVIFGPGITPHCPSPSWWTPWHIALVVTAACAAAVLAEDTLHRLLLFRASRMPRADRKAWRSARTLQDLGRLGALWLEGEIGAQPTWCAGPDDETLPLVPVLAAANRAGFYTMACSPGDDARGFDGLRWRQRAAVEGFADVILTSRLETAARAAGLAFVIHDPASRPRKGWDGALEVGVTERDGEQYTWFGQHLSRREIRSRRVGWGICRRSAARAICDAWQVTIVDPEWGREPSPLWDVLAAAVRPVPETLP